MRSSTVHLLDADPDLAYVLDAEDREIARRYVVAQMCSVPRGPWFADRSEPGDEVTGYLVLEGLLTRELRLGTRNATELLGASDLLRPWPDDDAHTGAQISWSVHEELRLAVLDRRVMAIAARFPALTDVLIRRLFRRTRALAFSLAMSQLRGIDRRLLVLFWDAANRWGRVTPDGVRVHLPLTHQTLAQLVGSRRPSVSVALGALAARGELVRLGDEWLLRGTPPALEGAPEDQVVRALPS